MLRDKTVPALASALVAALVGLAVGFGGAGASASVPQAQSAAPASVLPVAGSTLSTAAPASTVRLIFAHHSTGEAWLGDGYGDLGKTLRDNRYFVSDTNYGWGPAGIGNSTDIGHWWTWFRGPDAATYTLALYSESGQNCSYSRLSTNPGGENTVIMFKSCFPNSDVGGSAGDAIPPISGNPLKGNSGPLTVGNAKGIYLDLLNYFKTRPDKMFVLVVSPPLRKADTSAENAANARALANWLVSPAGLLKDYTAGNVFVFDYYTVLTGGHHRVVGTAIDHTAGATDYLAYPTGDSHPSAAGDARATADFVPMLNAAFRAWSSGKRMVQRSVSLSRPTSVSTAPLRHATTRTWRGSLSPKQLVSGRVYVEIQRRVSGKWRAYKTVSVRVPAGVSGWKMKFSIGRTGKFRLRARHEDADHRLGRSPWREVRVR
jgi:hypothetical protein